MNTVDAAAKMPARAFTEGFIDAYLMYDATAYASLIAAASLYAIFSYDTLIFGAPRDCLPARPAGCRH